MCLSRGQRVSQYINKILICLTFFPIGKKLVASPEWGCQEGIKTIAIYRKILSTPEYKGEENGLFHYRIHVQQLQLADMFERLADYQNLD